MTNNDIAEIAGIIEGFESWREYQIAKSMNPEKYFTVSAYVDELAKQRALDVVSQIQAVYQDNELPWSEVDKEVRAILGVQ